MIADGGTYTSDGVLVSTVGVTKIIGTWIEEAPPTMMTCEDGVSTGGWTGVGSLVTGVMTVPSPSGGVVWANKVLVVHTSIASPISSIGLNFIDDIVGVVFIFSILFFSLIFAFALN